MLKSQEAKAERERVRDGILQGLGIALVVALMALVVALYSSGVAAAPKAQSSYECGLASDMAVVARALAVERVPRDQADRLMGLVYDVSGSERGQKLMDAIVATAYALANTTPQNYAQELLGHCMRSGGDMDALLGTGA